MGSHDVWWLAVGTALLVLAAVAGGTAVAKERRVRFDPSGRAARASRVLAVLAVALAIPGWAGVAATVVPAVQTMAGDTVAGSAGPTSPGLVQAGIPTTAPTTKSAAPDPMSLLVPGDCVEVPMDPTVDASGAPTWEPGDPAPADCNSLDANYRVLQTGPQACSGNLYKLETSRHDRSGNLVYHLCLAFDWRVDFCYDTSQMAEPFKVDCATPGRHIVRVTAVLENTVDGAKCPRDGQGAVWVVWNKA
ncbi:LppU/SCO3897 family protein [Nocardia crassostreae]|uniref:LppU/SCO3897 family protein n=1 Tax=Nocardia crassostreae TaxID=53428 RepID=UPI000AC9773F|nr:hypothetical protein [Nocardia crassostreae]